MKKLGFTLLIIPLFYNAQENSTISTDRPSQSAGSSIVPEKSIQIETGALMSQYSFFGYQLKDYTYNTTLIRFGFNENFEFRLAQDYSSATSTNSWTTYTSSGFKPISPGVKIKMTEQECWIPEAVFIGHLGFGGTGDYVSKELSCYFRFAMGYSVTDQLSVAMNIGGDFAPSINTAGFYSLILSQSVHPKIALFGEVYGNFYYDGTDMDNRLNGGICYLLYDNLQLDLSGGFGLNNSSLDYFISGGVSFRFLKRRLIADFKE